MSGYDPSEEAARAALERGAVDRVVKTLPEAVAEAEAVFVAVPVRALPEVVGRALEAAPADCVVTDVGSTKRAVVGSHRDPRFVGGHPLAGAESSGIGHARADLFEGATWYLTPAATTSGVLYERLHRLLVGLGARPAAIDPETHDTILATVSHLPHVLANVLVSQAAAALEAGGSGCPRPVPASGTQRASLEPRLRSGPISTCRTEMRSKARSSARSRPWSDSARRSGTPTPTGSAPGTKARRRTAGGCSRRSSPGRHCSSCARRCRTAPGWSRRSRSSSGGPV